MNMISIDDALAQGSTPATFFSIAKFNEAQGKMDVGQAARLMGRELARILGIDIGGRRNRDRGGRARPRNDNASGYGKPQNRRSDVRQRAA